MSLPTRKSPFVTRISTVLQQATKHEPYDLVRARLTATYNANVTFCRILVNLATQPLPEQERNIRATSDPALLPGYWIAPNVQKVVEIAKWETDVDDYDMILMYCHGGAFAVGHSLMYSTFFNYLITTRKLRLRIYALEYELPLSNRYASRYPYQHTKLFLAYKHLLSLNIPPSKIILGGDNSGGFNALKCFEKMLAEHIPHPAGILLNSPLLDLWLPRSRAEELSKLGPQSSMAVNHHKDWMSPRFLRKGMRLYKPPMGGSPVYKGAKWYGERLPPIFLSYGTSEIGRDTMQSFATGLRSGRGCDLTVHIGDNEACAWNVLDQKYSKNKEGWEEASRALVVWMERLYKEGTLEENVEARREVLE